MSLHKHAMREFKAAGWVNEAGEFTDEMQKLICEQVLQLIDMFASHGHSGTTAPYAVDVFSKLAMFKPLVPLSGDDTEWNEVGDGMFQNNRCSHVFKQPDRFDGQPYDINAIVFWEWYKNPETGKRSKSYFTGRGSMQVIKFPYTPKSIYKQRKKNGCA